eukprot:scaffold130037_cov21-Tisochrysis_lutea.AAC.2
MLPLARSCSSWANTVQPLKTLHIISSSSNISHRTINTICSSGSRGFAQGVTLVQVPNIAGPSQQHMRKVLMRQPAWQWRNRRCLTMCSAAFCHPGGQATPQVRGAGDTYLLRRDDKLSESLLSICTFMSQNLPHKERKKLCGQQRTLPTSVEEKRIPRARALCIPSTKRGRKERVDGPQDGYLQYPVPDSADES